MARRPEGWRMYRHASSAKFIVRFTHQGRRYNLSTGERDPTQATRAAESIYSNVVSGRSTTTAKIAASASMHVLDELCSQWLAAIESALDETTVQQYGIYVTAHWLPFFGSLDQITQQSAEAYWRHRLTRVRRRTVLKELSALRGFLAWSESAGYLATAPVVSAPPKKALGTADESRRRKTQFLVLTEKEILAVIAKLPKYVSAPRAPRGYPVRARFLLAWETALRPQTLDQLRAPDDYQRGRRHLFVRDEIDKARFGRRLPLSAGARRALNSVCPDIGLIFGQHDYRSVLRAAAKASGLPPEKAERISPYDFRHSRLTFLAERSTNLAGIAYLAGHKHVTTTNRYIRPTERAAEAVLAATTKRLWPHTGHSRKRRKRGEESNE